MSENQELLQGQQQVVRMGTMVGIKVPAGEGERAFVIPDENFRRVVLEEGMGSIWNSDLLSMPFEHIYKLHIYSGYSLLDLLVIGNLLRDGPLRATDLSVRLRTSAACITERTARLKSTISIERNPNDRRSLLYGFTAGDLCRLAVKLGF